MSDLVLNNSSLSINRTPELIAAEINSIKQQTRNVVLYNSIEIGRRLAEAKQLVPHGEWSNWLEHSVDYSQRTATNLMRIFEEYGAEQISLLGDNAKSQALANLSYTQAVALLGIPEEEREQFVETHDLDSMSTRELQQAIKERDEAVSKFRNAEQLAKDKEDEAMKLQRALDKEREALKKEQEYSVTEISRLRKSIEDMKVKIKDAEDSGDDEEVGRLKDSLKKTENDLNSANSRILELEKQLKEEPIEATVATIEKVPEEIEKELEDLRRKALVGGAAEKFAVYFDELVKDFQKLLGVLAEIADADEESHKKYKNAINALLGKMGEKLV